MAPKVVGVVTDADIVRLCDPAQWLTSEHPEYYAELGAVLARRLAVFQSDDLVQKARAFVELMRADAEANGSVYAEEADRVGFAVRKVANVLEREQLRPADAAFALGINANTPDMLWAALACVIGGHLAAVEGRRF